MKGNLFLIVVIVMIPSLACAIPGWSYLPFIKPAPSAIPGSVYFDDFSNPQSGWYTQYTDDHSVQYDWGGLRFRINRANFDMWSYPDRVFTNAIIWVEAAKLEGTDDNAFGILCRIQENGDFYAFLISSDGYFGISRRQAGTFHLLNADSMTHSDAVSSTTGLYRLRAECDRENLFFFVNDFMVAEVGDNELKSGKVGVLAGTYSQPGVDIFFDTFIVTVP
jgi:hypothetical protein